MFMVEIVPAGDEFHTAASGDFRVLRKRYPFWPDATADAVELR
jgi:hypothetical protein